MEGSQRAGTRQQPEGMASFCGDPEGRAHSLWPKSFLANMHRWHRPAEPGMLLGNPRGFGFARNEMRRGWGDPSGAGGSGPASPLRAGGTKEEPMVTFRALHNLAQLAAGWLSHAVPSTHTLLPQPQLSSSSLGAQPELEAAAGCQSQG